MTSQPPTVSVGLPVYNGERYLRECLDGLLSQTYQDFEIVISDNASTDETETICRSYADRDARIRYHRQSVNRGANWNFNQVFKLSRGAYFKWAAVDDLCQSSYLERMVAILDSQPDCVWCHSLTVHIDEVGKVVDEDFCNLGSEKTAGHSLLATDSRLSIDDPRGHSPSKRFAAVLLGTTWCADSFGLIRSRTLSSTALEGPYYGAEKVLMAELALRGHYIEVPEVLFFQRIHPQASGAMQSGSERDQFTFGVSARMRRSTSLAILGGYVQAIERAKLGWREKCRCYGHLVRYACQLRKLVRKIVRTASFACKSPKR